jgi:hypothetical protein
MLKAIFAKHLKSGDGILLSGGERVAVQEAEHFCGVVRLRSDKGERIFKEYDLVGLIHRPRLQDTGDVHARLALTDTLANIVNRALAIRKPMNPQEIREAHEALEAYELGESVEPPRPEPEPENCYEGRCKHPKNFAGSCIVYLLKYPRQCDQRR